MQTVESTKQHLGYTDGQYFRETLFEWVLHNSWLSLTNITSKRFWQDCCPTVSRNFRCGNSIAQKAVQNLQATGFQSQWFVKPSRLRTSIPQARWHRAIGVDAMDMLHLQSGVSICRQLDWQTKHLSSDHSKWKAIQLNKNYPWRDYFFAEVKL